MPTPLPQLLYFEPRFIVAGDTASWYLELGLYPPLTWTLSYSLVGQKQGMRINLTEVIPSPDGVQHLIDVAPAITLGWVTGLYKFQSYVTNGTTGDRVTIGYGDITVVDDLADADPIDPRTFNRKMRDQLQTAILERSTLGIEHYSIATRSFSKMSIKELNLLLERYEGYVQQEEQADAIRKGKGNPTIRQARFDKVGITYYGYPWGPFR